MKTATREENKIVTTTPERRPFVRLAPAPRAVLPASAVAGLDRLDQLLAAEVPALTVLVVGFASASQQRRRARPTAPSVSALNRRRRAARQWLHAILSGRMDPKTLHAVGHAWLPQLTGTGPELHHGEAIGRDCVEFLRGAATARILARPSRSLVPHAKALHTLETVLAIHLEAYLQASAASRAEA